MNFVDYTEITVQAGNGGNGCVSFRREKYEPKGGPNGGDGGQGGSIIIKASVQLHTLQDIRYNRIYKAQNGKPGMGSNKSGKDGEGITILVPAGTIIKERESGEILGDLTEDGEIILIAKGGSGGYGNQHFATSVKQTPRFAMDGLPGEAKELALELKILADVGLVGFPNAGKSTLLSVVTAAKPKIADYPFTTLVPNLGIVKYGDYQSFVIADIPGLIEGAHYGKGLGDQFLKHIERTQVLVFLIDGQSEDIGLAYKTLLNELGSYSKELLKRPRILALSKIDTVLKEELKLPKIKDKIKIIPFSSVSRENLDVLLQSIISILQ